MDALDDDQLRAVLPALRRFARSLSGEPASADDLVQATLERALRRWRTRHTADALQPWLFAILYRQFLDGQRRAARWQRVVGLFAPQQPSQSASPEQVHDGRAMLASLASLPAEQRALLLLVSVEGFSYREVADTLGIPIGTVMSRLSRARTPARIERGACEPRTCIEDPEMTATPPDEHALHAYVDGRLAPEQHAAVAAWLHAHPAQAARVAGWKRDAEALRAAHAGLAPEMSALAFTPAAIRRGLQQRRRAMFAVAASCVLALGLGTGLGWQLHASRIASQRVPMADAVAAYRLFADAGAHQGVALDVQRRAELEPWLRTHFGNAGVVPDLRAQGYTLRGGQLLSTPEGAAAMLVYGDADGARIGLYLRPRSGPMPTGERRDGRLLAQYWAEGDTAFALVGPATQTRMRTIAPLLRRQG